jgi:response regulator RpfG family c-di-GMP phosphodiesterase
LKATPVCVVDGSAAVTARLAALFEQAALPHAVFFTDPLQALEWCLAERPPLVLVDDAMPGLGGLAFMDKLRVGAPGGDAIVALLSSQAGGPLLERALAAGAADVIVKPLADGQVIGQLRGLAALTRRRQRDWGETIARASALVRRVVCKDPDVVLPALRGCALAYGLQPAQCDGLEDAWHLLQASGPAAPSQPEPADACADAADSEEALRVLARAERDRSAREAGAGAGVGQADARWWAAQMLLYGNEHWDGSGGPLGLRGADIPVAARLFHLVNSYGLLRAGAAAGGATLGEAHALRLVEAWSGAEFDPEMVAGLCRSAGRSTAACAP